MVYIMIKCASASGKTRLRISPMTLGGTKLQLVHAGVWRHTRAVIAVILNLLHLMAHIN